MSAPLFFHNMSIKRKLLLVSLINSGLAIMLLAGVLITRETLQWHGRVTSDLKTYATIIGTNTAPALAFDDREAAVATLAALGATPSVVSGAVYDKNGRLFAAYGARNELAPQLAPDLQQGITRFTSDSFLLTAPIVFKSERFGTIYLRSNLSAFYKDLLTGTALIVAAAIMSFLIAAVFLNSLQKGIVRPITELSSVMKGVSESRDYSVHVTPRNADEVGSLAEAFNAMLAVVQERDASLAKHQTELEEMVAERTKELKQSNALLEKELADRVVAQETLREHDALLKSVTRSASGLLGEMNIDEAIQVVLELIAQTIIVTRVQLTTIRTDRDGHLRSFLRYEWCAPGMTSMLGNPAFQNIDFSTCFPKVIASILIGENIALFPEEISPDRRDIFEQMEMRSLLMIPILIEGRLWGSLQFIDSAQAKRQWSWAETDTLKTLAGLIGVAISRARSVKELADANAIVQNSPTILYRLSGEPSFPMIYISKNIVKFGYEAAKLIGSTNWQSELIHPDDLEKLQSAMTHVMEKHAKGANIELRLRTSTGGYRWVENRYTPVRDSSDRLIEVEGMIIDITERKTAEDKIALLARTDSLTGLANRATFVERLHQAFMASRRGATAFAVLYLDVDHFKDINDTLGHPAGDQLLRMVSERLQSNVRETDLVARLGGDEFAVLQMEVPDIAATGTLASKIKDALGATYQFEGNDLHVTASIGICLYSKDISGPDSMLSRADLALYRAKEEGRNQYRFHSDDLDKEVHERVTLADDLRNAIERDELELYYQPQVELASGRIVGMEALVRWNHPTRGLMTPESFLPIAEKTGVISALGHWVLNGACRQMQAWRAQGVAPPVVAINVAQAQLKNSREFVADVTDTLARCNLTSSDLELDVTESMLAQLAWTQNDVLSRLQQLGVRIALDNFGTEYSSFDYVRTYKVTRLKIAQCFIEMAASDADRATTIRTIINLAREMGIEVIAEGVESEDQRSMLVSLGPETKGQGFYFSKAVTSSRASELLRQMTIGPQTISPKADGAVKLEPTAPRGALSKPPLDAA